MGSNTEESRTSLYRHTKQEASGGAYQVGPYSEHQPEGVGGGDERGEHRGDVRLPHLPAAIDSGVPWRGTGFGRTVLPGEGSRGSHSEEE